MPAGRAARASPCSSSSTSRKAARTTCCTATPTSETFLSEMVTAQAYENRHMTMESMYEYGSRAGVWRILREFDARGLPLTVFGVAHGAGAHARAARRVHGPRRRDRQPRPALDPLPERRRKRPSARHLDVATRVIQRARPAASGRSAGTPAATARTPADSSSQHGGYEYDSDYYGDDLPFWTEVDLGDGTKRPHLVVPVLARRQRHALRPGAGLQHRRSLLRLPARQLRRALRRRRPDWPRPAEDDVDRHAFAACSASPAGSARCSASSTTSAGTTRSGSRGGSTSPATGRRSIPYAPGAGASGAA